MIPPPRYIAVVGPGDDAPRAAVRDAEAVGRLIAARGWVTLCGGRSIGVMAAAARGAAAGNGTSIGLLPGGDRRDAAPELSLALATGLGEARNAVLVCAADALVVCGINPGTASEIALAIKAGKPVALTSPEPATASFFLALAARSPLLVAQSPEGAIEWISTRMT